MQFLNKFKFSNIWELIKGTKNKKIKLLEEKNNFYSKSFSLLANSLNLSPLNNKHPLKLISKTFKNELIKYQTLSNIEVSIFIHSFFLLSFFLFLLIIILLFFLYFS